MKVGDRVTRNGSKVWEIAEVSTAGQALSSPLAIAAMGGTDAPVYRLKDATTGKVQRNVWWTASDLAPAS